MPFTRRQWSKALPMVVLWILISTLCGLSGPFGTMEGLQPVPRFAYWASVVGGSILGAVLIGRLPLRRPWQHVLAWSVYALAISGGVYLFNLTYFGGTSRTGSFVSLTAIVGVTVLVVHGLIWLARQTFVGATAQGLADSDVSARFQRRLPLEARGPLVRIEAQDHYLNVVTQNGQALILMRLAEAIEALDGVAGLQVHRSHWVALDAVRAHRRDGSRDLLEMSDGVQVPVARNRRSSVKDAGLI